MRQRLDRCHAHKCRELQIRLHGTYHRGNAGAVLYLKGITPSRDAITDFLEYGP